MSPQPANEGAAESSSWRNSLYIWDGIVSLHMDRKDDAAADKDDSVPMHWKGTWISTEASDATKAEAPKRNAFLEYVDSDFRFDIDGSAKPFTNDDAGDDDADGPRDSSSSPRGEMFVASITDGDGWDMEDEETKTKKKYKDTTHDVLVKSLKWSGNMFDQTENLIVAKGENEFGSFVSAGWMRPGNRWTLARRYVPDGDPRSKMTLLELHLAVAKETVTVIVETGQQKLKIPPWHCSILHSEYRENTRGEKRKIEEVDTADAKSIKVETAEVEKQ
jgi:hypothetical protein